MAAGKERVTGGEIAEGFGAIGKGRGHTPGTAGKTVMARLPGTSSLQRLFRQSPGDACLGRAAASDHVENRSISGQARWEWCSGYRHPLLARVLLTAEMS